MDEAGARARIGAMTRPPDVKDIDKRDRSHPRREGRRHQGAGLRKGRALCATPRSRPRSATTPCSRTGANKREEKEIVVTEDDIMSVVSKWTGVPLQRMEQEDTEKLLKMEAELKGKVIGQDEAVIAIAKALRRSRADLKDPRRPIGSFIFLGPTGVGKTFLAQNLAEFMFGDRDALIQLDMSEYMEKHTAIRLIGSPPGYVGYEEGGQLSEACAAVRTRVVLFDEIEKAHPERDAPPPADPRRGQDHRLARPQDRLPQHHHHPHVQHRRGADQATDLARLRRDDREDGTTTTR